MQVVLQIGVYSNLSSSPEAQSQKNNMLRMRIKMKSKLQREKRKEEQSKSTVHTQEIREEGNLVDFEYFSLLLGVSGGNDDEEESSSSSSKIFKTSSAV